jgi:hypothetical protein
LAKNGPITWSDPDIVIEKMTMFAVDELTRKRPFCREMADKEMDGREAILTFFCNLLEL